MPGDLASRAPHATLAAMTRLAVALLVLVPACATAKQDAALAEKLAEVTAQQYQLEQRHEALARQAEALEREQLVLSARQEELTGEVRRVSGELDEVAVPSAPPSKNARPGQPDPTATFKVDVGDSHVRGPKFAKVTIVAWGDYQCPFTQRSQATLAELREIYGNDQRIVAKHNPLPMHARAMPAALAAEAAGRQGKFWEMHDRIFAQPKQLDDDDLVSLAKKLKLDVRKFKRALDDEALRAKIDDEQKQGVQLGARGTPAFFVNGRFLSGAQPLASFRELIDEELQQANALVQAGVPLDRVYEEIVANGRTAP
jgi:protein-disulfide isomerase